MLKTKYNSNLLLLTVALILDKMTGTKFNLDDVTFCAVGGWTHEKYDDAVIEKKEGLLVYKGTRNEMEKSKLGEPKDSINKRVDEMKVFLN